VNIFLFGPAGPFKNLLLDAFHNWVQRLNSTPFLTLSSFPLKNFIKRPSAITVTMAHVDGNGSVVCIYPRRKAGESEVAPVRGRCPMQLTHKAVAALFSTSQGEAAQALGISLTTLKVVCRKLGISRWPYARVKKARVQNAPVPTFMLVLNDSLSSLASSATTVSRLSSSEPSNTCEWGHGSMHANGGDASVSSSGAWDGNIEAGCKLGDDLSWMVWNDSECLDSSETSWWERVRSSYDEYAVGAQAHQGIGGNMVFFQRGDRLTELHEL